MPRREKHEPKTTQKTSLRWEGTQCFRSAWSRHTCVVVPKPRISLRDRSLAFGKRFDWRWTESRATSQEDRETSPEEETKIHNDVYNSTTDWRWTVKPHHSKRSLRLYRPNETRELTCSKRSAGTSSLNNWFATVGCIAFPNKRFSILFFLSYGVVSV